MARGRQPSTQQLAEERHVTLQATTSARVEWDEYERKLLLELERDIAVGANERALRIVRWLQRGNAIEDADHEELYEAVRAG